MEGEENSIPPFWLQSSDSLRRTEYQRRRLSRSSSLFFNSGAFLIVLLVTALAFIFVIIPSIVSFTSQIFRPHLVKKSWDSLNLVLVLFAIVCGFLSRNSTENNTSSNEDRSVSNAPSSQETQTKSNPSTPHRWYEYSDRTESYNYNGVYSRLRSSSSYPDLRQESSWLTRDDQRWRFYDDTHVNNYRVPGTDHLHHRRPRQERDEEEEAHHLETKNIEVDTSEVRTEEASHTPEPQPQPSSPPLPSPPPPPPKAVTKRKPKRSYQAIGHKEETDRNQSPERNDFYEIKTEYSDHPPTPPSRPPPSSGKSEKKRGVAPKEFLTSLRRLKKKQRQKSVENFESIISSIESPPPLPSSYPPSSPAPPPPPPPPSVFHDIFSSKKGKNKNVHSFSPPPPPQPPPPPPVVRVSKSKAQSRPIPVTQKPSMPVKTSNFNIGAEDNANTGCESPLIPIPIPPPPPPPPFKIPAWKFVRHGDFVRVKSDNSSGSGSPDLDDSGGEDSPSEVTSPMAATEGGRSPAQIFCPSPDVDTKADNFIARFRAGLRLEKENSIKERDRGKSRLGLESSLGRED